MAEYDLVVRGGTVVTAADITQCDVGVKGERIVALGADLERGANEIDAKDLLVLPGGIDSHTHIDEPRKTGAVMADDFATGTASALAGGTTTTISFSPQQKDGTVGEVLTEVEKRAKKALTDYCFHLTITDPSDRVIAEEVPKLIAAGHRSLKIYLTYDPTHINDDEILRVFACARKHGALVVVHAENHAAIMWQTERLLAAGLTAPKYHAYAKPMIVEREATHRVIALAELVDVPIQIFHVSGAEAAEEVRRARTRGLKVWGETCAQYFVLTAADLDRPGFEGAKFICSPAIRSHEDRAALWDYVADGTLDVVTSDHAPWAFDDPKGKKLKGDDAPFSVVPNGVPGIETRLPILFHEGVTKGRIGLNQFVALAATNSARLFGLYPKKGTIAIGADADIVVWDAGKRVTITNDILHSAMDYTPYEGMEVTGWPMVTVSRGEVVFENGKVLGEPGRGRFLPRGPYDFIKPLGRFPTPFDPVAGKLLEE